MRKHNGFTIVELLIVIVIIGVLAMISIVTYTNIQGNAQASTIQSDLSTILKKLSVYTAENSMPPLSAAELTTLDIHPTKSAYATDRGNFYYCAHKITGDYILGGVTKNNQSFIITPSNGVESIASVHSALACRRLGLTGFDDVNAFASQGYSPPADPSTSGWKSWIK